jgi:hypothetical protein
MDMYGVYISTNISMEVQGVSPSTANRIGVHNHFQSQEYRRTVCRVYDFPPPAVKKGCARCIAFHRKQYERLVCPFLPLAEWMCRVYFFYKGRNVGLSGIQSVWYRNEQKCLCRNKSGTGIRGPSPVQECSGTRLRYRMPECQCRRH